MRHRAELRNSHFKPPSVLIGQLTSIVPRWDHRGRSRRLTVQGHLLKWLRRPAPNQEVILAAAQEDGWQQCILDPLPKRDGIDPKRRLLKAIEKLNHGLHPALRFYGNGDGTAVCWRWTEHALTLLGRDSPKRRPGATKKRSRRPARSAAPSPRAK